MWGLENRKITTKLKINIRWIKVIRFIEVNLRKLKLVIIIIWFYKHKR